MRIMKAVNLFGFDHTFEVMMNVKGLRGAIGKTFNNQPLFSKQFTTRTKICPI